jgi:CheY-like chemotaxis protein/nitrogen-specific signal transduction histidine kinase
MANALGSGATIPAPAPGGVLEVRDLQQALAAASNAVREREDALRAADRTKDEFLAMLSHELRNPLGAISSASAFLQRAGEAPTQRAAAVAIIGRQVKQMTRLVDDLLDVSRVTSGKISLSRRPVDLAEIVTRALGAMRSAGRLDEHDVREDLSAVWVDADEARIEQVVSNLVGNAVKYTPAGGRITVRTYQRDGDAVLDVEDTGVGLDPDLASRVFDLFVQGVQPLDRQAGGLGIGLTLVRRLVEMHGGQVDVRSDGTGRGSRFSVILPRLPQPSGRGVEQPHIPENAVWSAPEHRRVLVIEDNDDARLSLTAALMEYGYEVTAASDGVAGLEAASRTKPEVAIVDIGLGVMDGFEVARRLRSQSDRSVRLLVALSGYGHATARQQAFDSGFDVHLTKPVPPERLVGLIETRLQACQPES